MQSHCRSGFTFAELVIVILIIGVLAGIGMPAYWAFAERSKKSSTRATLANTQQAINLYKSDTSKYPKQLDNLVEKPAGDDGKRWEGPYIQKSPRDGWGQEFAYKVTPGGKHPFELYSYGKGGESDSNEEDYISVWDL